MIDMADSQVYHAIVEAKKALYIGLEVLDAMEKKARMSTDEGFIMRAYLEIPARALAALDDILDTTNIEQGVDTKMHP